MKVYPSKTRPNLIIHLPESLEDLKDITRVHGRLHDVKLLVHPGAMSSKSIQYTPKDKKPWWIWNEIDDTEDECTDETLNEETNILVGIEKKALIVPIDKDDCSCKVRTCPKCKNGYITPPALSRRDNSEICSACGTAEGLEDFAKSKKK